MYIAAAILEFWFRACSGDPSQEQEIPSVPAQEQSQTGPSDPELQLRYHNLVRTILSQSKVEDESFSSCAAALRSLATDLAQKEPYWSGRLYEIWGKQCTERLMSGSEALSAFDEAERYYRLSPGPNDKDLSILAFERAKSYTLLSRYDEALKEYDRAETYYGGVGDQADLIVISKNRMVIYYKTGRSERALEEGRHAKRLCLELKDEEGLAGVSVNCGVIYLSLERYEDTLREWNKALEWYEQSNDKQKIAMILKNRGYVHHKLKRFAEALDDYERAMLWYQENNETENLAVLLFNRGAVYREMEHLDNALGDYDLAIALYSRLGNEEMLAKARLERAAVHFSKGNYYQSLADSTAAADWSAAASSPEDTAKAFHGRGLVFSSLGRYREALHDYSRALAWYAATGNRQSCAKLTLNRGIIYANLARFEEALRDYSFAEEWFRGTGEQVELAIVYHNRGGLYDDLRRYDDAIADYDRAEFWYRKIDDRNGMASIALNRAVTHYHQSRFDEALRDLDRAFQLFDALSSRQGVALTYYARGRIYAKHSRHEDALEAYSKAAVWFEEVNDELSLARIAWNRAASCHAISRDASTLAFLLEALDRCDALLATQIQPLGRESSEGFRSQLARLPRQCLDLYQRMQNGENRENTRALTYRAIQAVYGLGMAEALWEGRIFDSSLIASGDRAQLSSLDSEMRSLVKILDGPKFDSNVDRASIKDRIRSIQMEQVGIIERARLADPVSLGFIRPRPARIEEMTTALPEGAVLLEYVQDEEGVYCAITSGERTEVLDLCSNREIQPLLNAAREFLDVASPVPPHPRVLRDLGRLLFGPIDAFLQQVGGQRPKILLVSLHGQLCRFPLEIILTADPAEQRETEEWAYLVRDFDIAYVHSGTVLREIRQRTPWPTDSETARRTFAAVAFPYDSDWEDGMLREPASRSAAALYLNRDRESREPLPGSALEVLEIASIFAADPMEEECLQHAIDIYKADPFSRDEAVTAVKGSQFYLLMRDGANERALKQDATVRNAKILHLACHAEADLQSPTLSRLVLSHAESLERETGEDGYVFFRELLQMNLDVELLVLAACETNAGTLSPLEGATSLSRAGLIAGARAVISTLWKVSDEDSRALLVDFYRNWIEGGQTRVHALSEAKRKAIREGRPMRTWAGYQLWDADV